MNEIDKINWNELQSAVGSPGRIVAELLHAIENGDTSAYDELFEQVCHQFSLGTASFPAAVVLVCYARNLAPGDQVRPLGIVGAIEASRVAGQGGGPSPPEQFVGLYERAIREALSLSSAALAQRQENPEHSYSLIATLAALQGHANIALHLLLCPDSSSLSCPECGEYIDFLGK
jgi:hypothetical protein